MPGSSAVVLSLLAAAALLQQTRVKGETAQLGITTNNGGGACAYETVNGSALAAELFTGSISSQDPLVAGLPMSGCGSCIQVTCNLVGNQAACRQGALPVTLLITDSCPSCQLNAPTQAFDQIINSNLGSVNVLVQLVACPANGSIIARINIFRPESDGGSYIKLVFLNAAGSGSLSSVRMRTSSPKNGTQSSPWIPMSNTYGAAWEASQLPAFPLNLQLTNSYNQTVIASSALKDNPSGDVSLGVNFPASTEPSSAGQEQSPTGVPVPAPNPSGPGSIKTSTSPAAAPTVASSPAVFSPPPSQLQPPPAAPTIPPLFSSPSPRATLAQVPSTPSFSVQPIPTGASPLPSLFLSPPPQQVLLTPPAVLVQPRPPPNPLIVPVPPPAPSVPAVVSPTPPRVAPAPAPTSSTPILPPSPLQLEAPATGSQCRAINEWIQDSPSLKTWYSLLQNTGYVNSLAQPNVSITMFAPINEAFSGNILAGTTVGSSNNVTNINQLLAADPSSAQPLIGYHIIKGVYKAAQLTPGLSLNTTDTLKQFGVNDETLAVSIPNTGQVKGIGSTATILQADLPACGPTVIHVINSVLLPFSVDSSSTSPSNSSSSAPGSSPPVRATEGQAG